MQTKPKRKVACLTLGLAMIASACGTASQDPIAFTDEPVVLTMWTWPGGGHELVIDQFEAENPDITVDVVLSGYDQHNEGLLDAVAASGEVPDVALIDSVYLPQTWEFEDQFTDLRPFGADDLADDYLDWRWDQAITPSDRIIGLPTDVGGLALAYRRDLFANAGLPSEPEEVTKLIQTWDDLLEVGARFQSGSPDDTAAFIDGPGTIFEARFGQETAGYVTPDGEPAVGPNSAVQTAWNLSTTAVDAGLTGGFRQFSPEWNAGMADGGFAMLIAPSWMRGYMSSNAAQTEGDWGLIAVPGVHGNWGGSALTIPKGAENPEAAWKLIQFMTSESIQFEIFQQSGNFPSTPASYTRPEITGLADPFFDNQVVGPIYIESVLGAPVKAYSPQDRDGRSIISDYLIEYAETTPVDRTKIWPDLLADLAELKSASGESDDS